MNESVESRGASWRHNLLLLSQRVAPLDHSPLTDTINVSKHNLSTMNKYFVKISFSIPHPLKYNDIKSILKEIDENQY